MMQWIGMQFKMFEINKEITVKKLLFSTKKMPLKL